MMNRALQHLLAALLVLAAAAIEAEALADEPAPNPYDEPTPAEDRAPATEDPLAPIVPNRVVAPRLQLSPAIEGDAAEAARLYRTGRDMIGGGIALGVAGTVVLVVGAAIATSSPTTTECSPDYAGAFARDLANSIEGGGGDYPPSEVEMRCTEVRDTGAELAGITVAVIGAGALATGVLLGVLGAQRQRDAIASGFDPSSVAAWVSPTDGGAMVGVTVRR